MRLRWPSIALAALFLAPMASAGDVCAPPVQGEELGCVVEEDSAGDCETGGYGSTSSETQFTYVAGSHGCTADAASDSRLVVAEFRSEHATVTLVWASTVDENVGTYRTLLLAIDTPIGPTAAGVSWVQRNDQCYMHTSVDGVPDQAMECVADPPDPVDPGWGTLFP